MTQRVRFPSPRTLQRCQVTIVAVTLAPSWEFAAGVAWLAGQLNASVRLPERRETAEVTVMIDEVTR